MLILPLAVVVGLIGGRAARGSWSALSEVRFRHPSLVLCSIAAQAALELPGIRDWPSGLRFTVLVVSYLVAGWWVFENARASLGGARIGLSLLEVGWILNLLAIVPNGGMPVSESALERAGIARSTAVVHGHLSKHVPVNQGTILRALGDVIPLPWFRSVISPGDIVMAVGIGILVAAAMRTQALDDSAGPIPRSVTTNQTGDS